MHTYYIIDELEYLSWNTKPGLFLVGHGGPRLWVFESLHGLFALQLDTSPKRPKFSYCKLGPAPIAIGLWLGPVLLQVGEPLLKGAYMQAGFICSYRDRLLVKANAPYGVSERLALTGFDNGAYSLGTIFYRSWALLSVHEGHLSLFDAPLEIDRMTPYSGNARWDPSGTQFQVS